MCIPNKKKMQRRRNLAKKATFSLKFPCSLAELHLKYELEVSHQNEQNVSVLKPTKEDAISYMDEARKIHKCCVSRIEMSRWREYRCFWDHHPLTGPGIGCPVRFAPSVISRAYVSEITREEFIVKESVARNQRVPKEIKTQKDVKDYYETDHVFCGFGCAMAFIDANAHNPRYAQSKRLLRKIHMDMFGTSDITPAHHYFMLSEYGGTMDISKFRSSVAHLTLEDHGRYVPPQHPSGHAFEEKIRV